MSGSTSRTNPEDIICIDCNIAIPKGSLFANGLCQMCNADLRRHLATLERYEVDREW